MAYGMDFTRVNGLRNTVGTLYQDMVTLFKITVKTAAASAIDLRDEDDAMDEVVEAIVRELNPLSFFVVNDNSGVIYVIMDKHINSSAELQVRIRRIGVDAAPATTTSIGPNDIDISGTTVQDAVSMTFGV
jgi:hypothetical protein